MADPGQEAVRVCKRIRQMLVDYRRVEDGDEEAERAQVRPLDELINELLVEHRATTKMYLAECSDREPLRDEIERLKDQIQDMKRPMSAQMEMQNCRIVALTAELDELRIRALCREEPGA